jgi:hypothetical protein
VLFLFFLLVSGDVFLHRLVEIMPRFSGKRQVVEISQQIESDISAYLVTITIMNAAVGIATALAMWLTGVGDPILWGTVAFLLNYVPILGTALGVLIFLLAGLLTIDTLWQALLPAGLYIGFHLIEGEICNADASGQTVHPQSRPSHHLAHLLVLDVGYSGRDPLGAHAGDCQDHLRPCSAAGCIWPLSRGDETRPPSLARVYQIAHCRIYYAPIILLPNFAARSGYQRSARQGAGYLPIQRAVRPLSPFPVCESLQCVASSRPT